MSEDHNSSEPNGLAATNGVIAFFDTRIKHNMRKERKKTLDILRHLGWKEILETNQLFSLRNEVFF